MGFESSRADFRQVTYLNIISRTISDMNRLKNQGYTQLAIHIDHEEIHKKASALAHRGSGQWLINNALVKQWNTDKCGLLWLRGKCKSR